MSEAPWGRAMKEGNWQGCGEEYLEPQPPGENGDEVEYNQDQSSRLEEFAELPGLYDEARSWLKSAPEERQRPLMASFPPLDECTDVSSELNTYAKSEISMQKYGSKDAVL